MGISEFVLASAEKLYSLGHKLTVIRGRYKSNPKIFDLNSPGGIAKLAEYLSDGSDLTLNSPYTQLAAVYSCIQNKARNIAHMPKKIINKKTKKEIDPKHPINLVLRKPNPLFSGFELWEALVVAYDTHGEIFLYGENSISGYDVPGTLFVFSPSDVKEKIVNESLVGWEIKIGKGKMFFPVEIIAHDKYYNPSSSVRGLAPLKPLSITNKIKWGALRYNQKFFENDATPPIVYENEKIMKAEEIERFKDEIIYKRAGVNESHKGLLLHGGVKAKTLAQSMKDIQLLNVQNLTTEEICQVLGVPKS
jgi:HK97 family phage portal protein